MSPRRKYEHAIVEYSNARPYRSEIRPGTSQAGAGPTKQTENYQAAFAEYVRAADALPDDRDVQVKATALLLVARQYNDAKARAAALVAKNPKDVEALVMLANASAELNDSEAAAKEIEEADQGTARRQQHVH